MDFKRRKLLKAAGASSFISMFPPIARALSIPANARTGTIQDVEHVVILMQENRSFDHYFGTMAGIRGYSDPYPAPAIPTKSAPQRTVLTQCNRKKKEQQLLTPFLLNTRENFKLMRVEGTPHTWADAQEAWDNGRMSYWPEAKYDHSMGYFEKADIPFQYALAEAFTLCDAYHCSIQAGTNPNRVYLWAGANDAGGKQGGPVIGNSHDSFPSQGGAKPPYTFNTYIERLDAGGISWSIYQDMADNFTDNPLVGFKNFRDSFYGKEGANPRLAHGGLTTRKLDQLKTDVLSNKLPAVSYIIATAEGSEHPGPSSPVQGAAYTAEVLDALTANPDVWSKTVLFINFDENDGFFDHVPPPAPPSPDATYTSGFAGFSQISTEGEYHRVHSPSDAEYERAEFMGRPYGLGPRVPAYVISPWSRGGYINSEVLDHTSIIRFLEARFNIHEPNITPWRRAVCGDFINAFDFVNPNNTTLPSFPDPSTDAKKAAKLEKRTLPATPVDIQLPEQEIGDRPHRPCVYDLDLNWEINHERNEIQLTFHNQSERGVVFHIYDRLNLDAIPRRYTLSKSSKLTANWKLHKGSYDIQVMGPEGFHRRLSGSPETRSLEILFTKNAKGYSIINQSDNNLDLKLEELNSEKKPVTSKKTIANQKEISITAAPNGTYNVTITNKKNADFLRQFAGRLLLPG